MLQGAPSGSWLIPLLSRMGQLGMMDLREGLVNPKIFQYTSTMNNGNTKSPGSKLIKLTT